MVQMSGSSPQAAPKQYPTGLLNGALVLAAITGILHLYIGLVVVGGPYGLMMGIPLDLIGLVYFGGVGLVSANYRRDLWLKVGLGWVVLVLVLWALTATLNVTGSGSRDILAYVDKADEIVLLGVILRVWMIVNKPAVPRK